MLQSQIHIYTESTPNPQSMKFVFNVELLPDGMSFDYTQPADGLTKDELFGIKQYLKKYFEEKRPIFSLPESAISESDAEESEVIAKIKEVLEQYVKPAVESDGGAISFYSFDEESGQVKVLLQGSCSGCPSSTMTLKAGIEALMTRMVPQVKEVVAEGV